MKRSSSIMLLATALAVGSVAPSWAQPVAGGSLDPTLIPKYVAPLMIPPVMPPSPAPKKFRHNGDYYEIAVRQFQQQVLPTADVDGLPLNPTTVWGYGSANDPTTFSYPGYTIEARVGQTKAVKWINDLTDPQTGNFLPHLLPVDQTLHWANPPGPIDSNGTDQMPYTGPVPLVTHLHGAHTTQESDGFPEAWYLPAANDIPADYTTAGSYYDTNKARSVLGSLWTPGSAVFVYPNKQRATTLWYHDHVLGMTRANVYAGLAGFYILRGGPSDLPGSKLPGPAPALRDRPGTKYHEIPMVIQDRSFNTDGSLFFPDNRAFFEGLLPGQLLIPFAPEEALGGPSDVAPIWNPEFFGNTMVVNGKTWPALNVDAQRYRFRLLNGCNARTVMLKLVTGDPTVRPAAAALPFWQIGSDGGFLPAPAQQDRMLIGPAERADVIVDFGGLAAGTEVFMINEGPDFPFGGGVPGVDFVTADPGTTGQVMKFIVGAARRDKSTPPAKLRLPRITPLKAASQTRQLSLNELDSATVFVTVDPDGTIVYDPDSIIPFGPVQSRLGTATVDAAGVVTPNPLMWESPVTENPALGATEIWEFYNFTADAHPIHIHVVQFQVINRQLALGTGAILPPEPGETGFKDTVLVYPGQVTRVKAKFDIAGLFVWHCHILDHEDNEMMRPYTIGQ